MSAPRGGGAHRPVEVALKRALDLCGAAVGLAAAAPVMLAVGAVVRATLGAPVFFRQVRPGRDGHPFRLWKFRTMTDARDATGALLPDGDRLTRVGRFLRTTSLDELPQLLNVLTGDMSLVGPRPLLMRYLPRYDERQRRRMAVKPGITGLAQVSGRNALEWTSRLELDVRYAESWSLGLDLRILARTLLNVARAEGVMAGGGAELDEFWGAAGPPSDGARARPVEEDETATRGAT